MKEILVNRYSSKELRSLEHSLCYLGKYVYYKIILLIFFLIIFSKIVVIDLKDGFKIQRIEFIE